MKQKIEYSIIKIFLSFCLFIIMFKVNGQEFIGVKEIITLNYSDTIEIKRFNEEGQLIFNKIYPQYGVSQIIGSKYEDGKEISFTWSHSNIGFIEIEYEFDSVNNTISAYSYHCEENIPIKDLMKYNSIESLKESKEFKEYYNSENRFLQSIKYLENNIVIKEEEFDKDNKLANTLFFLYDGEGRLVCEKTVNARVENYFQELIYVYDKQGNEIKWAKVYNSTDTSIVYQKRYEGNRQIEEIGLVKGELDSRTIFIYMEDKLAEKKQYDDKGELKISSKYKYNPDGKINCTEEVNLYIGRKAKAIYFYYD